MRIYHSVMKWKNLFSLPKRKKVRKALLDHLNQPDSKVDANQVTGGIQSTPNQPDVGWLKTESSNEPKV